MKGWNVHQMDVVSAFLNGDLLEEVYMTQPKGFTKEKDLVCKLQKSLYGLKQASRAWYQRIDSFLLNKGLKRVESDHSIYTQILPNESLIITIYVDDLLLVGSNLSFINDFKNILSREFNMKDLGEAKFILGIKIERATNHLYLSQEEYLTRVLRRFGMTNCKSTNTPLELGAKNSLSNLTIREKGSSLDYPYRKAIGCLMYAMLCTRPDLGFPICFLSQFSNNPNEEHWIAVKRVLRYIKGTLKFKLKYETRNTNIVGYTDADWAGDVMRRKSTSGFIFLLGNGAISWGSKNQACVALSTTEAKYIALSQATREVVWLQKLMCKLLQEPEASIAILVDN